MNKVYNVIWSSALNALVVVAEGTKNKSKSSVRGLRVLVAFLLLAPASGMATTLPQGGVISIGEGTIVNSGAGQMIIKQNTDKLGINWQSFNVGADGQVIFDQPNKNSVALNRVIGSDASSILGRIEANGQVFLINPNGVIFGKDSKVNVGGLVASTLDITDENFKNGNYTFSAGAGNGEIINNGTLQSAEGGYVAVLGKSVKNNGLIKAQLGTAALAAGEAVTLDFSGDGLINVQVDKSAVKALVENQGVIQADGGSVLMTARATNALMDTVVNNSGLLQAQTINNKGGKISLDGGPQDGTGIVLVGGTLDASAPVSGNGGFIETSGKNVQVSNDVKITTASASGSYGNWVLDPDDLEISAGNGAQTSSSIGANTLGSALALTNVELKTAESAGSGGNILVNADVAWSADTKLTLTAHKDVKINANIKASGDHAGVELNGTGYSVAYGKKITLAGSDTSFAVNGENYTVLRSVADIQGVSDMGGHYVLANDFYLGELAEADGGKGFAPIGTSLNPFTGAFDGLGHLLTGLSINRASEDYVGLFGYTSGAQLRNLMLETTTVGGNYTGGLVGYAGGDTSRIDNISVLSSNITGNDYTGGVVGFADGALLSNLYTALDLHGGSYVGGIAGEIHDAAGSTNVHQFLVNASVVEGSGDYVGGVVGLADGMNAHHLESTGATSTLGGNYVGGIAGALMSGSIKQSFTLNDVNGVDYVGGLVGLSNNSEISQSYTTSNSNSSTHVGGLVGRAENNTSINESFTTGSVKGASNVGGLVGSMDSSSLYSVYTDGTATSTGNASGGLVGSGVSSSITDSYSLATASQSIYGSGSAMTLTNAYYNTDWGFKPGSGTASTTAELQSGSAWTAGNTSWVQSSTAAGPYLGAFMTKVDTPINLTTTYDGKNVELPDNDSKSAVNWFTGGYNNGLRGTQPEFGVLGVYSGGVAIRNAGTYTLDATANARFAYLATGTVVVNKRDVTVEANGDQVKTYDQTTAANLNLQFGEGFILGDSLTITDAKGTYDNKNAGAHTITVNGYKLGGADLNNYRITVPSTVNGSISKANAHQIAQGLNKVYNRKTKATANASYFIFAGDSVTVGASSAFSDKNAGTNKTVTTTWTFTGADAGNYDWVGTQTSTATITKYALDNSVNFSDSTYNGTTNASYGGRTKAIFAGDDVVFTTSATFLDKNVGTNKAVTALVTATGADAGNYTWTSAFTGTASILKATLDVKAFGDNKVYDGSAAADATIVAFNKILYDNLTFSGTASFSDKNAGDGKTVSVSGINVTGADAGNYVWNTTATTTANITKAELTIAASGQDKTYDSTQAASVSLTDNRFGLDDLIVTNTGAIFTDKNAGADKLINVSGINLTGADAGNYIWNTTAQATADIARADLVITVDAESKTYDGTRSASVNTHYNKLGADDLIVNVWTSTFDDKNAGTGKLVTAGLSLGGADAGNYNSNGYASTTADISKAQLTVTAAASSKAYDATTGASVSLSDDRIAGDSILLGSTQANFVDKNAGLGKTVTINGITVTGADAGNYEWNNSTTAVADIGRVVLGVTATGVDKTYDGTKDATINLTDSRLGSDDITVTAGESTFTDKNADAHKQISVSGITVKGTDAANYIWDTTAVATADINKAVLNVSAVAADKTYDGSTAVSTTISDNRIGSDDLVISGSSKFADKNAGVGKTVIVDGIEVTGQDAQNYTWNDTTLTTANIAKAQLAITLGAASKDYDSTTHADVFLSDNRVSGDSLTLDHAPATFDDKNAGTGKTVTVDGITVTGADAGNYVWATSGTTTADIGRAVLSINATGVNKTYDGTTAASADFNDNRLGADDLTVTADTISFVDKNADTGKQISISGITVSGAEANNYIWDATVIATADITKAHLEVSATATGKTYDGTTGVAAALSDNRIAGDNLVITSSNSFADKNAGADKTVHIDSISVTGSDALNYEWNAATTTAATIDKAQLQVDATASNKTYDGSALASTVLGDNRVSGDNLVVSSTSSNFSDKNAGFNKVVTVGGISISGADAANYASNTSATAQADISKASLVITADAQNKVYDGSVLANTSLSDNRVGSDDLVISSAGSSFSDKNAADGKTVTVNGIGVTGADATNYTWSSSTTTNANIAKANLSVTASASDKVYDGSLSASTVLADNRIGADDLTLSNASSVFNDKNAASDKTVTVAGISVSGADAQNYTWNTGATTTADIAKAQLDITIGAASKDYDTTAKADVFINDNRVSGDSLAFTHDQAVFDDKNAGSGKIVTVQDIGLIGADAGNYEWNTSATTTADIGRAVLGITATGVNKTYDGTNDASATLTDSRLGSDDLTVSADNISFVDKNADSGKQISISGISVTGADASNYIWDATAIATADIAKAALNVSATAAGKTYDGTTGVSTTVSDNRIGSDDLVISSNSAFADKNAGIGKEVIVDSINVTGADARNYVWNADTSTTADISKAQLVITVGAASKDYDSTAHADAVLSDNHIAGDSLQLDYGHASFSDKNAGTAKAVAVEDITVTGVDAGNYEWNTRGDTTADIGRAVLTISATGVDKTYDGTTSATAIYSDNRLGSDSLTITADDATFIDKNAGAGKQISISGVTVSGADASNYIWDATSVTTASISKANLVVSATASDKVYNGSTAASSSLSDNRIGSDDINLSSTSSTFSDKNAGDDKVVTVSGIAVSGADAQNYDWNDEATTTADITKAQLDVTAGALSKDYDSTRDASVVLNDNRVSGDSINLHSSQALFDTKDAGLGKNVAIEGITVTGADAGNYTWNTQATATADVGKAILSISAAGVNKTYDGTTSGNVVLSDNRLGADSLTIGASDVQFVDKNADTGKQMSVSGITVTGADALNYIWDASTLATADINKAVLNVSASALDKTYDGTKAVTTTLSDNRIGADDLTVSGNASFADKNAGDNKLVTIDGIAVTGADARNYTWNANTTATADIGKAQLNITTGAVSRDYDATTDATAVLSDDRISGDNIVLTHGQAKFEDKNAGIGKTVTVDGIDVSGEDAGNYTWSTTGTATADIGRAVLTIDTTGINKTYDGTTDASTTFTDNRFAGDDLTVVSGEAKFIDKNAGANKQISISGISATGSDASNYIWDATAIASADITKASLNVTALANDKVYDGNTAANTVLLDNRVAGDNLVLTRTTSSFADKNAGSGKAVSVDGIAVSGADAQNYTWNSDTTTTADISRANLIVEATGSDKTYDSTTAASATLSDNRILGDGLSISYGAATFEDKNAGTGKAIHVDGITVTGVDAGNYTWNASDVASANIDKANLTVTASGVDKTYDGTKAGSVVLSDSRFANDDLILSADSSLFDDKNAGAGKTVSVTGINVTGADALNYTWNTSAAASADIGKATLNVGATAHDKVYDTSTTATIGFTDNRVSGDILSITGSGVFADKNAGAGKAVSVSGINITGADASNYTWNTLAIAMADISKANLVISAVAGDKTYDGSTTTSSTLSDNRLAGDNLVLSSTDTNFSDKNAGIGKAVTVSGISVAGSDADNYEWNTSASTSATINKAVLTVSGAASDKVYDGSVAATANLTDNRIGSDDLTVTAGHAQFSDKNAGLDKLVSIDGIAVAGADASNYVWNTTATSTADIAKATLSVTATAQDKVYDATTTAAATIADNRVAGDDLVIDNSGAAFSDKNTGAGKLVTVSGITLSGADAQNYVTSSEAITAANINKASLNVVADAADKVYNGTTGTTANLADNRLTGDDLNLSYGSADFADKNAGSDKSVLVSNVSVSGADAMNYTWNTTATGTASISKANLAISASGDNRVYDGTTAATVDLADNRVVGDQITLVATSAQFADKNAGAGKSVDVTGLTVTGEDAGNYTWNTTTTAQADITNRALQISGEGMDKTYDRTTVAGAILTDDRVLGDSLVVTSTGAAFADKNAGIGKSILIEGIDVAGADANNYTWNSTAAATADIGKAQLTVTATAADKVYNGSTAAQSTYSDDRLTGDALTVSAASSLFSDKNAGAGKTVTINGITLSGDDAQNYTVNSVAVATANISQAVLTVGAAGTTKVYDGSTEAQVSLTDNRVVGDDLIVANAIAKYSDKNAGANKAVDVNGIAVSGADSSNYTWNESATTQGNIEKANLIISGIVQDKVYDGTTQATLSALNDNRISGDNLTVTASGAVFGDKNAGANKAAMINGISVTGSDADNYNWSSLSTSAAEITKAFLQLAAVGQNKVYDGTTQANISVSDDRISGDQVGVTVGSAQFDNKNAGVNKTITATGLSLTGVDAGNYMTSDTLLAQADVAKAEISVSADQISKLKGNQDPSLSWKLNGGALFAGDVMTGSLERVAGEELGTYAVGRGSLDAGDNYNMAFTAGALTIADAEQKSPTDIDSVVSALKTGVTDLPTVKQEQRVEKALGYNMLNLGIKLPETLMDGMAMNTDEVEILE